MQKIKTSFLTFLSFISQYIGLSELFFLVGMASLYCGLTVLFSQALAQTVCGAVLVFISILIAWKSA